MDQGRWQPPPGRRDPIETIREADAGRLEELIPIKMGRIPRPSETALFADAAQINTWQAPASLQNPMLEEWYYVDDSRSQPNGHFRHGQRANVVFCDGHVAVEKFMPGSLDLRMPNQSVGQLRPEILIVP